MHVANAIKGLDSFTRSHIFIQCELWNELWGIQANGKLNAIFSQDKRKL